MRGTRNVMDREHGPRAFHIVTLGCSKNRVDSDGMDTLLRQRGMVPVRAAEDADVVIVNTCGFLGAARAESIGVIGELLGRRPDGQRLIAAGCLPALGNHVDEIPEGVDHILTTREWYRIGEIVGALFDERPVPEVAGCAGMLTTFTRAEAGPSAYVKIADGCDHNCAFCTIPSIKGRQVSKAPLHVIQEIVDLVSRGTKEIVLVAQDTIRYGADLGIKHGLPSLLESIAEQVPNLPWLRMLYIYPSPLTLRMVDVMARHESLLPYLDMPLQHADREVLRRMNRPSDPEMTMRLIDHARTSLPDLVMRTTFIVGYPGETDEQFAHLLRFVEEQAFDHVGVFTYSPEPGTRAASLDGAVPSELAEERRGLIMEAQQRISHRKNLALVGTAQRVLVEAVGESEDERGRIEPISVGRTARHAPEVDGLVFIPGAHPVGEFVTVRIADATPYDLWAADPSRPFRTASVDGPTRRRPVRSGRNPIATRLGKRGRGQPVPLAILPGT
jgi:ribosomal protein S12 methylthiotransferase